MIELEKGWNSKRMITEGEAAIPLVTTRCAFRNQEKSKQRSAIDDKFQIGVFGNSVFKHNACDPLSK